MTFRIPLERPAAAPIWNEAPVQRVDGQIRSPVAAAADTYMPRESSHDFYNGGLPGSERSPLSRVFLKAAAIFDVAWEAAHQVTGNLTLGEPLDKPVENPRPVILLGGMGNTERSWNQWRRSLERDGFPVYVFHDKAFALGDVVDATYSFEDLVQKVKRETGAAKVDAIGFSSGGHPIRTYVQLQKQGHNIGSAVFIAVPNQGCTDQPLLASVGKVPLVGPALLRQVPIGEYEELYGSPLMEALAATDSERGGAQLTSIYPGAFDGVVAPQDSPYLPHAKNVVLSEAKTIFGRPLHNNHFTITQASAQAYEAARQALLDGLASPTDG